MPTNGDITPVSGNAHQGPATIKITNASEMSREKREGKVSRTFPGNKVQAAEVDNGPNKIAVVPGKTTAIDLATLANERVTAAPPPKPTVTKQAASSVVPTVTAKTLGTPNR